MNPDATTPRQKFSRPRPSDRRQKRQKTKLGKSWLYSHAIVGAFVKLHPQYAIQNPVIVVLWVAALTTLVATFSPEIFGTTNQINPQLFNGLLTAILFSTIWLVNFAQALAEGYSKAQAHALQLTKSATTVKKLAADGTMSQIAAADLRQGDTIYLVAGEIIPADGEVIMGVASVDESVITGESAPVLKEFGSEVSSTVIGGTKIIADELIVQITAEPGKGFIDRMIVLLGGAKRRKTPNEAALTAFSAAIILICLFMVATIPPLAYYVGIPVNIPMLMAFLVAMIPITLGGLLNTIGIACMNRVAKFNVIATSARAIEDCGDLNTLILDKTGTITIGNRLAEAMIPIHQHSIAELANVALAASIFDDTPEGKSIVRLAERLGAKFDLDPKQATAVKFSVRTCMSGTNLMGGREVRKGAVEAIKSFVQSRKGRIHPEVDLIYERIAKQGGTPLAVCLDNEIYGLIYLKDMVKSGVRDRFEQIRQVGVRTVMLTGDNRITASVIAREAGLDEFIAEATPDDKITVIQREQSEGRLVAMTGDGDNDAPALAQANVGVAMSAGTQAVKQAANMIDLDSDPTKLIDIVHIGKQLLMTRGALLTFSMASTIAKALAIVPAIFANAHLNSLNLTNLTSPNSAVLSVMIYNALTIPAFTPLVLQGVKFRPLTAMQLLGQNIIIYGLGGAIAPFMIIKIIDMLITLVGLA